MRGAHGLVGPQRPSEAAWGALWTPCEPVSEGNRGDRPRIPVSVRREGPKPWRQRVLGVRRRGMDRNSDPESQ